MKLWKDIKECSKNIMNKLNPFYPSFSIYFKKFF